MFYFANLFRSYFLEVREVETQRVRSNKRTLLFYVSTQYLTQCFVQQVCTRVVGCTSCTFVCIYTCHHRSFQMFRKFLCYMDRKIVFLLGIDDIDSFEFAYQYTGITYLTTTFCIERSIAQYNLVKCLILLFNLTVTQDACFVFSIVVTYESCFSFFQCNPVACFYGSSITCAFFLFLHFGFKAFYVGSQTIFTQDKFSQVEWESECIIQCKCVYTADFSLTGSFSFSHCLVEQTDTCFQCTEE